MQNGSYDQSEDSQYQKQSEAKQKNVSSEICNKNAHSEFREKVHSECVNDRRGDDEEHHECQTEEDCTCIEPRQPQRECTLFLTS